MAENRIRFRSDLDDKVSGKLKAISANFDKVGKSSGFKTLVQGVGLGIGHAAFNLLGGSVSAVTGFLGESADAARDMAETLSKSNVIFGSSARSIEQFGDTAARSLGLSKQAAIESAAGFGNLFTGLGKTEGASAEMSKRMVTLAADLASFNNLDPTETLDKLRAGLAGEAEPLRRVGVFLNEAKVKAKAMELGLADANGELTEGAKVTARYHLILEETTSAQGDFARTADGVANSQRSATAALKDMQAALGQQLLPAEKSVTEAQISLFTSLEAIGNLMAGKTTPETLALGASIFKANEATLAADLAALQAKEGLDFMTDAVKDDRNALNSMTPAMINAAAATEEFHKDLRTAKERSDDLKDSLQETANALIDNYYDPIEQREDIADNNRAIRDAKRVIRSKTASDAEIRDAKRVVTESMHQNDLLTVDLVRTGNVSTAQFKNVIKTVNERIRDATGKERTYLINLRKELLKLQNLRIYIDFVNRIRTVGVGSVVHRQHGGEVTAGNVYVVGEQRPELFVPQQNGTIMPRVSSGASTGGNVTINLSFSSLATPTPSEGQRIARAILPELRREIGRQGLN
jgi:hypothetical protein